MPVGSYGVGIGDYVSFSRDDPDQFGHWFHGHITLRVPDGRGGTTNFESAIDVNAPTGSIEYFHPTNLDASKFATVAALPDGQHPLAKNSTSGALDYKRNPLISVPLGCLAIILALFQSKQMVWTQNSGNAALDELEAMFANPAQVAKVYLFGAAYKNPPPMGVHDVHCNQGDSRTSGHQGDDGVWQDGGVIVRYADGHLEGFFVKFSTQTLDTNDTTGLPNDPNF